MSKELRLSDKTQMFREALESAQACQTQLELNQSMLIELGNILSTKEISNFVTVARGSSDHAAQYLGYLSQNILGKLHTSLSMSLLTHYHSPLDFSRAVSIAISQSGQSPDVVTPIQEIKRSHAPTIAMVNVTDSPLAKSAEYLLPLHAGPEKAVAATKSFITSLYSSALFVSHWKKDLDLISACQKLPDKLKLAQGEDWNVAIEKLKNANRIMVVGRGYGLSLALEASLKFKETCGIQAEAFSSAEIKHGPMALIESGYPLFVFGTRGPTLHGIIELVADMKAKGANVIFAAPSFVKERDLTLITADRDELDVICAIQSFYLMISELAVSRGLNPDQPRNLNKVTLTK